MGMPDDGHTANEESPDGETDGDSAFDALLREAARTGPDSGAAPVLPQVGDVLSDKYRIERQLGRGGMGAVFAATHLITQREVALKWMLGAQAEGPVMVQRLVREARAAGRVQHPNVVDVYDVGEHQGVPYLVMSLLSGRTLRERLVAGPLQSREAVDLLMLAARGVAAAHRQGVVHRDLKPDNLFLCEAGEPGVQLKILDFGVSKLQDDPGQASLTQSGAAVGTPHYMAPEQARGRAPTDERVDVYALSTILYEMVSGARPFQAESYNELLYAIWHEQPIPLERRVADLPAGLSAVVDRGMAKRPEDRFADVEALACALEPFASVPFVPVRADGEARPSPQEATARSRSLLWAALICGLLAGLGLLLWSARPAMEPATRPSAQSTPQSHPAAAEAGGAEAQGAAAPPPAPAAPVIEAPAGAPASSAAAGALPPSPALGGAPRDRSAAVPSGPRPRQRPRRNRSAATSPSPTEAVDRPPRQAAPSESGDLNLDDF